MLEFFLALLTTATVTALLVPLVKPRLAQRDRLASDTAVYRDQLAEVERERGRTLAPAEADAARTEIERRLLAAADKDLPLGARHSDGASSSFHRLLTPALCLAVPLFALGLYLQIGTPGLPSAPFFARAHQPGTGPAGPAAPPAADEAKALARTIAALRARLAQQPDDPEALSALGEALTRQADGVVTPEAIGALRRALGKAPDDPRAMFYLGLADAQGGDSKAALERWQALERKSPADAPWRPTLRAEMERVARASGLPVPPPSPGTLAPPSAAPGPTPDQVQAMQNLPPEERMKAIRGMVAGLEQRLAASQPATPAERAEARAGWLRLANARRVLGEADKSAEAYAKADRLAPLEPRLLADWAETEVRQLQPGQPPGPAAVAVLERLEKAEPSNGLALFYLGAADFAKGDKAAAARRWKTLLAMLPADAPIRSMLEAKIKETE
ncbi:MAG: c-type cytochrome biogenesis protein CcmI [Proteobacteria bacterium]|nr:c-type cytochrome biogenesis protein CcmI [Pseudomonadota bacterium]